MNRSALFWGSLILIIGSLLFFENIGLIPGGLVWPIILIFLGVWLLFGRRLFRRTGKQDSLAIPLMGISDAEIVLEHGAGKILVTSSDDSTVLLSGTFGGGVDHSINQMGATAKLKLRVPSGVFNGLPWFGGYDGLNWNIKINREIPIKLVLKTGASENELNLDDLHVTDLRIETGASSTRINLPSHAGSTTAKVEAGAASVDMRVPDGVAARIYLQSGLSGINIDTSRFPRTGNTYESSEFTSAINKIDIKIETGVGSITVR